MKIYFYFSRMVLVRIAIKQNYVFSILLLEFEETKMSKNLSVSC